MRDKQMADLFDVVEFTVDLPQRDLRAGQRGTLVEHRADDAYEVEFANETGETQALVALGEDHFIIVWRAQSRTWVPVAEQVAALVASLPERTRQEVLDFTRFLYERSQTPSHLVPGSS